MTHRINSDYFSVQNTILKHYLEENYAANCKNEFSFNVFIHVLQNWKSYLPGMNTQPQVPLLSHLSPGYILIFDFVLILSSHLHQGFKIVSSFRFSNSLYALLIPPMPSTRHAYLTFQHLTSRIRGYSVSSRPINYEPLHYDIFSSLHELQ